MVYIFEMRDSCNQLFIKIGRTDDITTRIKQVQTNNPFKVKLLTYYSLDDDKCLERMVHNYFLSFRVNGEWFKVCEKMLPLLCEFRDLLRPIEGSNDYLYGPDFNNMKRFVEVQSAKK